MTKTKTAAKAVSSRKCPVLHAGSGTSNQDWWPKQLNLKILSQNSPLNASCTPHQPSFSYRQAFQSLDYQSLKSDLHRLLTSPDQLSSHLWPADYSHYGPLFIRLAWHAAGTYRIHDGRGGGGTGQIRFAPLNSWPDNANLDKARRLLWPIKKKYGNKISWADLMILVGNVALESMGCETVGFGGGRVDVYEPEDDVNWGLERTWLEGGERYGMEEEKGRVLAEPLAAVQMGLIYVNPEGPGGVPDPLKSAVDIRETFGRMGMNDEETVALIAGGHTFGKCHGAGPASNVGPEPEGAAIEEQGLGWKSQYRSGKGGDTITSGIEGAWTANPTQWDHGYFNNLFGYEWELSKSPAGAHQWKPKGASGDNSVVLAHDHTQKTHPIMTTADMALIKDPLYLKISKTFHQNPTLFHKTFAEAWYKLTHRDMGPVTRLLGPEVPSSRLFQDPLPSPIISPTLLPLSTTDIQTLKAQILSSCPSIPPSRWIATAWASASTFRQTDKRGGANGARIRFSPQNAWMVNEPLELQRALKALDQLRRDFGKPHVSMADLIVLAGCAGVEAAAKKAGISDVIVPFIPGRVDAVKNMMDERSFDVLEPKVDGFRNYVDPDTTLTTLKEEHMLLDRAHCLSLTPPEMTVLVGGLRVLGVGCSYNNRPENLGVLTHKKGTLSNDFFIHLLDTSLKWTPVKLGDDATAADAKSAVAYYEGRDCETGELKWKGSRVDLIFGSHSVLRAYAEVYASDDGLKSFVIDFCHAFAKVMNLDRFDLEFDLSADGATPLLSKL